MHWYVLYHFAICLKPTFLLVFVWVFNQDQFNLIYDQCLRSHYVCFRNGVASADKAVPIQLRSLSSNYVVVIPSFYVIHQSSSRFHRNKFYFNCYWSGHMTRRKILSFYVAGTVELQIARPHKEWMFQDPGLGLWDMSVTLHSELSYWACITCWNTVDFFGHLIEKDFFNKSL